MEVVKADHSDYCSDAENEEEITFIKKYYEYSVNEKQFDTLIWINHNYDQVFNTSLFLEATQPNIIRKSLSYAGSGYCNPSIIHDLYLKN